MDATVKGLLNQLHNVTMLGNIRQVKVASCYILDNESHKKAIFCFKKIRFY